MSVTVTVVMPAYNASQYLGETIESVLAQIFKKFELMIIDDGSTDNTAEIAYRYCQQDSRIKLFSQPNQGVSVARNTGIKMAQGEFIAFIDADDQWLPNKLTSHVKHLNLNENLGISFGRVEFLSLDGKSSGKLSNAPLSNLKPQHFLYENPTITGSNLVVRRELFQQVGFFNERMKYNEDLEWCLRVMCTGNWNIEGINKVLMRYRTTEGGLSSQLYCMEKGWYLLMDKARQYAPELVAQHYSKARAVHLRYLARRALRCSLPSHIGVDFMTRALLSDWKLMLREPRRTLLTMLAIYGQATIKKNIY